MSPRVRFFFQETRISIGLWIFFAYLYWFVAHFGPGALGGRPSGLLRYVEGPLIHLEILLDGLMLGGFFGVIRFLIQLSPLRRRSFRQVVLLSALLYLVSLVIIGLVVYMVFDLTGNLPELSSQEWIRIRSPRFLLSVLVWSGTCAVGTSLILEMRRKLGSEVFGALLTGRYFHPREEERVFLFMDLKDSTAITERLGHALYSLFIRKCYRELSDLVLTHQAQIYQYVGDEVVLSWRKDKDAARRCVALCLEFQQRLRQNAALYEKEFDATPVFRGGADLGTVTAAEVGEVKLEVAYHGDVLNTAARLLGKCKDVDVLFLVSEKVQREVSADFRCHHQGELELRGKSETVQAYSISQLSPSPEPQNKELDLDVHDPS